MREVRLFNSLGNKMEVFSPIKEGEVSFYFCGPTVYNDPHIGNMRPVIVFDTWRRLFLKLGYKVSFTSNYTDVDDKIINRAISLGITEKELTDDVIKEYRRLVDESNSLQPDNTPKPSVYMDKIIKYIQDLVDNGKAYVVDGDVYFRVNSDKYYGELSGNSIEALNQGARIEINSKKESPLDFALWKKTEVGIKWDSPWSQGRPGWHSECCVMIDSIYRENNGFIDIHGGGFDLKFPHHENEIAQSLAHNDNHLAKYWLHNGFIDVENQKMSKSLGNVILAKDVFATYGAMPFRLMLLNTHYRAPLPFSEKTISEAQTQYTRICQTLKQISVKLQLNFRNLEKLEEKPIDEFLDELCNDLNTPNALTILYAEIKNANNLLRVREINYDLLEESYSKILQYLSLLGIRVSLPVLTEEDREIFGLYNQAKAEKDFEKSDKYRAILIERKIL